MGLETNYVQDQRIREFFTNSHLLILIVAPLLSMPRLKGCHQLLAVTNLKTWKKGREGGSNTNLRRGGGGGGRASRSSATPLPSSPSACCCSLGFEYVGRIRKLDRFANSSSLLLLLPPLLRSTTLSPCPRPLKSILWGQWNVACVVWESESDTYHPWAIAWFVDFSHWFGGKLVI